MAGTTTTAVALQPKRRRLGVPSDSIAKKRTSPILVKAWRRHPEWKIVLDVRLRRTRESGLRGRILLMKVFTSASAGAFVKMQT
jgi:hypothetical protein